MPVGTSGDTYVNIFARTHLHKTIYASLVHGAVNNSWLPALQQACSDIASWQSWIRVAFGITLSLELEKIALHVALTAPALPREHAAVALAYMRAAVDASGYRADPQSDLDSSLRLLAGSPPDAPAWADHVTGKDALWMFFPSVRALAASLCPSDLHRDAVGNPCRDLEHRMLLAIQVTNYGFMSRMGRLIPPPDTDPPVTDFATALAAEAPRVRLHGVRRADDMIIHSARAGSTRASEVFANALGRSRLEHCNLAVPGLRLEMCLTVPQSFVFRDGVMRSAARWVARNRPFQLLLLAAMLDRGGYAPLPLVEANMPLVPDLCYAIRRKLHGITDEFVDWYSRRLPELEAAERFVWHH